MPGQDAGNPTFHSWLHSGCRAVTGARGGAAAGHSAYQHGRHRAATVAAQGAYNGEELPAYVRSGFYDGTIFHRVIFDWIIQGGGYDKNLNWKKPRPPIKNEADNGLKNVSGTIAMARGQDPDSADSQFYINVSNNSSLDHKSDTRHGFGYCVFGKVIHGMDVVKAISEVETHEVADVGVNVPVKPIVLEKAEIAR